MAKQYHGALKSHDTLMFVSKKDAKQSCDATMLLKYSFAWLVTSSIQHEYIVLLQMSFVFSQHSAEYCLASFWKSTNTKILWDLSSVLTEKESMQSSETSTTVTILPRRESNSGPLRTKWECKPLHQRITHWREGHTLLIPRTITLRTQIDI